MSSKIKKLLNLYFLVKKDDICEFQYFFVQNKGDFCIIL